jgi:hypothetical protein
MERISISIDSLKEKIMEFEKDGMELAELHFVPSQVDDGNMNPAFLHMEGISREGTYKDYESIGEYSVVEYLLMHMPCKAQ